MFYVNDSAGKDIQDLFWLPRYLQIQLLLSEYLDIKNTEKSRQQAPCNFDEQNTDIGIYFAKKRPQKPKKVCHILVKSYFS